jgi:hypothetical protein
MAVFLCLLLPNLFLLALREINGILHQYVTAKGFHSFRLSQMVIICDGCLGLITASFFLHRESVTHSEAKIKGKFGACGILWKNLLLYLR